MKLDKVRDTAIRLMRQHGLVGYTFKWDNAVRRFGSCHGGLKTITLSIPMTQHESNEKRVTNTILHEIAHGLDYKKRGFSNHDSQWKKLAKSIGCSGERCSSDSGVDESKFMKWVTTCPNCEIEVYYARKTKTEKACGVCCKKHNNNKYTSEYNFNWALNPKTLKYR